MEHMRDAVVYIHGKGGSAEEAEHYRTLFPRCEVTGFDYSSSFPWEAAEEFGGYFKSVSENHSSVILIANSLGAYLAMSGKIDKYVKKAYFISPVVDMEKLISDMMKRSGVTEDELCKNGVIRLSEGKELSWEYLRYVREHPILWNAETEILYGSNDFLTTFETVKEFAAAHRAGVTVMSGGEHWFHTEEQMLFLDRWILACENK